MCLFFDPFGFKKENERIARVKEESDNETDEEIEEDESRGYCVGRTAQGVRCSVKLLEGLVCSQHASQREDVLRQLRRERYSIRLWGCKRNHMKYDVTKVRLSTLETRMERAEWRIAAQGGGCVIM